MISIADLPTGTTTPEAVRRGEDHIAWVAGIPFIAFHLAPLAAVFVTVTWRDWVLCAFLYVVRMFFITAGYHRYFSHKTFRAGRVVQFLLALGGTTAVQKGPLWWAGHHRIHHRYTDLDDDVHSPRDGFWWSHVGWILSTRYKETNLSTIKDFAAYPELRFLDRYWGLGPLLLAGGCFVVGGWGALLIGFFLSTVLLWHGTFIVNSLAHLVGRRRYATPDTSRNSLLIALVTGGEGWHNNHHYLPSSVRQGFAWWEFDPTWYALCVLAALHVVHDLKVPPERLIGQARVRDGAFDIGMFRSYWERAARVTGQRIADLTTRPVATSPEVHEARTIRGHSATPAARAPLAVPTAAPPAPTAPAAAADNVPGEAGSALAGLIARALESANQLAAATRRTRAGARPATEPSLPEPE